MIAVEDTTAGGGGEEDKYAGCTPESRTTWMRLEALTEEEQGTLFPTILRETMDYLGIKDLKELHQRFLEAGGKLDYGTFVYHVERRGFYMTRLFTEPFLEALRSPEEDVDTIMPLVISYMNDVPPSLKERLRQHNW